MFIFSFYSYLFQELRFGRTWIANDAHIQIAPQACSFCRDLRHSAEQHQKNAFLDLLVAVNGGEQAVTEVAEQRTVLGHLIYLVQFRLRQPLPHRLIGQVLDRLQVVRGDGSTAGGDHVTGKEGQTVGELTYAERLQARYPRICRRFLTAGTARWPRLYRPAAWSGQLPNVRDHDQSADELAAIARLRQLHGFTAKNDLQRSWNGAPGQFSLCFLSERENHRKSTKKSRVKM